MRTTIITTYIIISLMLIWGILNFSNQRTEKLLDWADLYEQCVEKEYGMMPYHYYSLHGSYPPCKIKRNSQTN